MKGVKKFIKKLTYFDIGIIVIIVVLGLGFFFFFYRKAEYVNVRVKVTDQDVLYATTQPATWYANRFNVGDVERDALGRIITEVVGVESYNVQSDRKAVYLDMRVRATYDSRTKLYSARGKTLIFGAPMRFNLSNVTFDGIVTEFPGSEFQKDLKIGKAIVTALERDVEPAKARSVKAGDEIYDSNGILLAELVRVDVVPAEKVTATDRGELLLKKDPLYKDVALTLSVRTKTINGETFIFDNVPLKVNEDVPFNFPQVTFFPFITSVSYE